MSKSQTETAPQPIDTSGSDLLAIAKSATAEIMADLHKRGALAGLSETSLDLAACNVQCAVTRAAARYGRMLLVGQPKDGIDPFAGCGRDVGSVFADDDDYDAERDRADGEAWERFVAEQEQNGVETVTERPRVAVRDGRRRPVGAR